MKKSLTIFNFIFSFAILFASDKWDGSDTIPVHNIPVKDYKGITIVPKSNKAMSISTKQTCGACHDYKKISQGWHFNTSKEISRPGEPWIWTDKKTGTQLPISNKKWEGTFDIKQVGLSPWEFTKLFGHHLPGGGISEPESEFVNNDARWDISGKLEINCLGCHSASNKLDMTEWAKQIGRENFQCAGTATSGLGEVKGMASRMPNSWDIADGPNPDTKAFRMPPYVDYNLNNFDKKNKKCFIDIAKTPQNRRCLQCHSSSVRNPTKMDAMKDVHTTRGMQCVQCHKNGLSHKIGKGYDSSDCDKSKKDLCCPPSISIKLVSGKEKTPHKKMSNSITCQSCHLNKKSSHIGMYGAPTPAHKGLPPIHLKNIACTTCHSSLKPGETTLVRTSRANVLGIHGRAQWDKDLPYILEPIFKRGCDGKIAPHRMIYPAYWGILKDDKVTPLRPDVVLENCKEILNYEEKVVSILNTLKQFIAQPVFTVNSKIYVSNADNELDILDVTSDIESSFGFIDEDKTIKSIVQITYKKDKISVTQIQSALIALSKNAPKGYEAAFINEGKLYQVIKEKYSVVPKDEANKIINAEKQILKSIDDFAKAKDIKIDRNKCYKGWKDGKLQKLSIKDPLSKTVKDLYKKYKEANKETKDLLIFTDAIYRLESKQGLSISDTTEQGSKFVWLKDNKIYPLIDDEIKNNILNLVGNKETITENLVKQILTHLSEDNQQYVYISNGKMFMYDENKNLIKKTHKAAEPYFWAIGHSVRPAAQSLGSNGNCTDCHSPNSKFLFAEVATIGPLKTTEKVLTPMYKFAGLCDSFHKLFGLSFMVRSLFKWFMFGIAILIGSVILVYGLLTLRKIAKFAGERNE